MSDTDKTKPLRLRMNEPGFRWDMTSTTEKVGLSPKAIRHMKRATAKRNRRNPFPHAAMRGYGWGQDNVRAW